MHNTYRYIASLLVLLCVVAGATARDTAEADTTRTVKLWQGMDVETDLVSLTKGIFSAPANYRYEALARINLKNKYYPVIEAGYEKREEQLYSGIDFQGSGLYYRLGVDFNLIRSVSTQSASNKFLLGARLGMSDFSYDVRSIPFRDPYTGMRNTTDLTGLSHTGFWFEIVAGIRIEVFRNVKIGWSVRSKNPLGEQLPGKVTPYYIPGYGMAGSGVWSFSYMIGYQF